MTLNNSTVSGNVSVGGGGGIVNEYGGILTLNNSTVSDNTTIGTGGGIINGGGGGCDFAEQHPQR